MKRISKVIGGMLGLLVLGILVVSCGAYTSEPLPQSLQLLTPTPAQLSTPELLPTLTSTIPPVGLDPKGQLAQTLQVISDQLFEIQSFPIQETDEVEASVWSPDSQAIIVARIPGAKQVSPTQTLPEQELWVLNLDGTGYLLDTNAQATSWSPDGRTIAYLRCSPATRECEIWIADWPQGNKRQLATRAGWQKTFWQGNDKIIFSTTDGDILAASTITLQVLPSTDFQPLVKGRIQSVNFVLSPDGMWLALEPRQKEDKLTLFYKGENDTPWIVPSNPKETYSPIVGSMAWSPNGTRLAFASYELGDKIHVVDVHTKQEWSIPIYPSARSPHFLSWSPDGNIVAFAARNERTWKDNLYIVNVDGSHLRNLSRDESLYVRNPTWSPNGRYIFYSEYSDKDFTRRPRLEVTSQ